MGKRKRIIANLILIIIFIACAFVFVNRSVLTDSLKAISNKRNEGTNVYRVSYVSNGGKWTSGSPYEYGYLEYVYGDYIGEPTDADITHNGCTLEGWYTDSNYTNKWDFSTGTVDQNMTLYANWKRNIYTVEFREIYDDYTGEDVVLDSVEVPYGYTLVLDGEASDENLTFKYNGPELSTTNFKNWISSTGTYTITQDTVFFARYENENVYVLNVNYLFQNGAVASHNKVTTLIEGGTYNLDTPIIRGYTPSTNNINGVLNETSVAAFQADDETGNADNVEVKKVDDTTYYVTYFILFTPNQTTYKVNHYLQKVDLSGYDLQESIEYDETIIDGNSKTVYVGDKINPILNTYEGFTHNTEKSDITGKALPDGEAELNQYYDRNTYYIYTANTGDTYFDPIPVIYGASINFNETATRRGYTFNGWTWSYTLGGEAIASLSTMPARDLYVSANWTATTATYIFSYYEEYANSDTYVNIGNIEQSTTTGTNLSTLNLTNSIQNGFNSLESENQYFHYNDTKTLAQNNNLDINVSGDGTTKINIYFDRNRYTIIFDLVDSGATMAMGGNSYTTATEKYSFIAKYNQDISTIWPTATDFTKNPSQKSFSGWKRNGASNTYVSMRNSLTYDMVSSNANGSSTTYQAQYISGGSNIHLYYMAESFDQTSPATTTRRLYRGVYYDSIPEYEQTVKSTSTSFSAKELPNLTKVNSESTTTGNGNNRVTTYYFYYSRNTLNLTFWNVIENDTNLSTTLPYGSDLSSYNSSEPNEYPVITPGEGEWTFDQWYQDPDCTIPMDFNTALETNLTVYAKWIPPQYNITFDVNEGEWNDVSSTYTDNGDGTYSHSVDEATILTPPTEPTRYGYTFEGWYYDAEIDGVQRNIRYIFDESQKIYDDLSLEAHWSSSLYVQYRVKYIKGQKDINGDLITDINQYSNYETVLDDKVVTNILFDSTVTEQAANVIHAGEEIYYLADSQFKTLKLDAEDAEDNIIYFFYDSSDEAYYTVYYLRYNNKEYDRSETPDPTEYLAQPKTITLKTAADGTLVSERAETIFGYTVRDNWYQELQLIANQDHNKMFFYYDNNSEYGDYSVNIYLMDSGTEIYGNTPAYTYSESGIVGSTIFTSSYLGKEYIPTIVWDTYKLDNMYSDTYIIISDGEDVVTDLNIYLKLKDYTITYQLDEGTWSETSNIYTHNDSSSEYYELVKSGNTCTEPTDPTKVGYNFLGWFDENDNEFDFSTAITSDLTLVAKWNPRTDLSYTVKYIDNAKDIEIQTQKVVPNNTVGTVIDTSTEVVGITGYTYDSCNVDSLTISGDESSNVIEIYYTPNDVQYIVNHWGQKEGGDASIHDAENYDLVYPETLYGKANAEVTPDVYPNSTYAAPSTQTVTIAPDGSTVVNYYYTRNGYTLTLYKGLGIEAVYGAGSYQAGATVSIDALVKDGYVFRAWTDCDCGGVEQCQCNPCECNAVSELKQYSFEMFDYNFARTAEARPIVYTISYDGHGATSGSTESSIHTFDEPKTLTPNGFVREYTITYDYNYEGAVDTTDTVVYEFDGWNCTEDGSGNSYDDEQEVLNIVHSYEDNQTLTAYAQWTPASSTNLPTRTGYIFAGWYEDEDTTGNRVDTNGEYTPTADKTLYAKWVIDPASIKDLTYTVEYYKDNILVSGDTQVVTETVPQESPNTLTVVKENINTTNKYEGYRLDSVEPNPIPDTIESGSTIKVKYVKRTDLTGTINHYWTRMDGTNPVLHESTQLTGLTFDEVVVGEEQLIMYEGYVYDHSDPETINVGVSPTDNVINIYYHAKYVPYTVNHWVQILGKDPSIHDENNYDLEYEEQLYGEADTEVTPDVHDYFYYISPATQTVTIARDGSTVVNYYYGIKTVKVTVRPGPGIESVTGGGEYLIWSDATIDAVVKEGYTWLYWNICNHDNCTNEFPCPDSGVNGEKNRAFTVGDGPSTAVAEARPNVYTITYNGNGATGGATETSSHTYDTPKNLTPNGYERKYTITYDYNYDEQADTTQTVAYGFNGWNDAQDGSGNSYNNEAEVLNWLSTDNANKDIYAQWTTSSNTNTPTREGYIFAGWYDNEETTGSRLDINGEYTPTSDITLYAKWEIDDNSTKTLQYTVEYYKDNVKVEADTIVVTDVVQVLEPDTITVNSTLINDNDKYEGYRLDHTDPTTVPSVVNTGTTIQVYYVKRTDLTGTINHYLTKADGTNATLKESTPLTGLTYNDVLTGENYQNTYAGYTYYSSNPETIIVEELGINNVINLYYRANTDVPYTVNYWIQKAGGNPSIHDENNYELANVDNLHGEANTEVTPEVYIDTAYISPAPQTVVIAPDGSTVVNYYYPMNMVRLTLRPGVGIDSVSGAGTYQAGSDVTIDAVVKAGYTWETWNYCTHDDCSNEYPCENNNIQLQKRVTFPMFDTPITAVAEAIPNTDTPYIVRHWTQNVDGDASIHNGTNYTIKDTDNLQGTTDTQVTPETKTYTGFTSPNTQTITIAGDGSTVVNYYYTRNSYDVTLDKDNGIATVTGAGSYLYEAEVTITAEVKEGYTWKEWTGDKPSSNTTYTFTMPAGNVENKANTNIINYTITYEYYGEIEGGDNPTTYNVETETFELKNPFYAGYWFVGWTGSNGTEPQQTVIIEKGSTGNKTYEAIYYPIDMNYTVNHWQQNVTGNANIHDETNYTLKEKEDLIGLVDSLVTPETKAYTGFTVPSKQSATISLYGDTVINYYYTRNSYNVTLDKDNGISTLTGAGSYLYDAPVTITAEVKDGYTWKDWTGSKASSDQTYTFAMPAENVVNRANTTIDTYSITYTLNDGTVEVANPISYTVETDSFTLNNPSKIGYTFTGWTGSNGTTPEENVTITKGTTGNIEYVANYNPITYTITYDGNGATGGSTATSNHTYDVPKNLTPNGYERKYTITYDYNYDEQADTTKTVSYGFNGWNDAPDGSGNSYNNEAEVLNWLTTNNDNKVIYADWTSTSDTNNPTRFGYIFVGWYEDEATTGNKVDTNGEYTPTSDKTLYAKWIVDDGNTKEVSYTVEYYKDGTIVPEDTQVVTDTIQVLEPDIITVVKENINTTNKYEGYRLDNFEPNPIPNTIASGSTIKVKYVKRTDLTGTINHYLTKADGTNATLKESTPLTGLTFNDVLIGENYKNTYAGYTYYSSNPETIIVEVSAINNVINLYYRANTNTSYTVKHWTQNLTGDASIHDEVNYTLQDTDNLNGETNIQVTPDTIGYLGFTSPSAQTITIAGDGSTIVDYYYTRNSYDVTLDKDNGIATVTGAGSYLYEAEVTITAEVKEGYTWKDWTGDKPSLDNTYIFTMPAGNVENKANTTPNTYTVEYDGNGATGGNTEPSTHIYDVAKNLTPNGYERKYTITYDYNYDEKENTTKTVAYSFAVWSDGRTRRLYNDEESVINLISTNNGTKTIYAIWDEASDTNLPTRTGYRFEGWYDNEETTGNRLDTNGVYTPTADITLYAKWGVDDSQEKELKYTLEYYKDNVLAESKDYTKTVQVLEPDTLEVIKSEINTTDKYVGYDFVNTDPITIPDVINHNSTIKVYYKIKDYLTYTVKYIDVDTNEEIKTAKPVGNQTYNTVVNTSTEVIDIDGYNYDHPEVASITISVDESANIINLYYKKAKFNYTVEYYYDNIIDNTKTDTFQATYKDKISTYQAKPIDGYTLDKVEPTELEIGYVAANNVMRVYYKKAKFNYTVEYYYDNVIDSTKTETKQATFKDTINTYTSKNITGYALNNVANLPLTISSNEANNIIKVYYVRAPYSYTVNYYFNNVIRPDLSETYAALFNDSINTYDDKVEVGYKLDRVETLPLVVTENSDANILSVYYITDPDQTKELKYTIKYYKDGVEANSDEYTKTVQVLENDIIEVDKTKINTTNKYDGYYFVNTDPSTIPDEVTTGTVIKVNYTIRNDLSYTVEYWDKDENETIKTSKVVDNQTYNSEILSTNEKIDIDGYDYDSVSADSITIKTDNSLNIIKFYYTKRTDLEYKVNYLLKDSDNDDSNNEVIHSQKVQGNMIFKSVVTSSNEVIDIDGYNYDSVNVGSITISANVEQNIINIFYNKRTDLKYTVNYLEKDSDDDDSNNKVLMTQKVQENQTFGTIINSANEVIAIAGYNYVAPSVNSISIKTDAALNVITLYYTPRTDLSYKVNYLLKDADNDDSNNTILHASKTVSNQSYLTEINPADEEVFVTGYKVVSYSSNPLIVGLDENVLTIYYSKDESQTDTIDYTIQYYKDGVIVPTDTESISSTIYVLDKITFTPNVNKYEGYNYDSVNSIIPEYVTDGAVIKVYYTSRTDLSYTVQYLQKETSEILHIAKEYDNQTYGDSIVSANEVISIDGYNYDSSNVPNLVIGTDENENIIKLYYTKRTDLSYVVNYLELSTNKVLHNQKVYNNITFDSEIKSIDEIISIDGYKYDTANVNSIKIKTNVSQNIINIYYTKVTGLAYTVRYLDKSSNEEIATAKVVDNQTFEDEIITSNEVILINGYIYNSTNIDKLIISTNNNENIINIYYNKRSDLSYSVKYIDKDTNTPIESPKVVNNQVFNTQIIASSEIKDINGYNFNHLNVDKLSIGTGENIIIVYYSKITGLTYKVNYLLLDNDEDDSNNLKLAESKIGSNKTYKDEINPTNEEKVITGYKVAKYSSNPLVITTDESKNVLTIYYEKDESQTKDIHYTIQYYKDNVLVTTDTETYSSTIYVLDNITFTPNVNKYEGYEYDSVNSIIPNTIGDGQTIKVLYTTRKDLSYKVNYYEKGTNVVLQEPLQVINVPYNKVVKLADVLKDIPGYKFAEADNSEITIGVNIELNVINVFYTKRTDLSYIVKYIDKDTGEEIKNSKVVPHKILGEVIDSKDEIINVDGYNYDSVEEDYLTIGASLNEMKVYFTKRKDIEYKIEYYFDDVLDESLTQNIKAIYLQKIEEYKKAQRKGYTLDKEESFPLTISFVQEDNIIKIFYKRIVVPIRVTSIDKATGRIIDYYEIGSKYGDEYIINEKEFEGYSYVGTPSNIVGLTDTEVINVTFYYEPAVEKSNNVIKVQNTGLSVIPYSEIVGVIFIVFGMTILVIYTLKDKYIKEKDERINKL